MTMTLHLGIDHHPLRRRMMTLIAPLWLFSILILSSSGLIASEAEEPQEQANVSRSEDEFVLKAEFHPSVLLDVKRFPLLPAEPIVALGREKLALDLRQCDSARVVAWSVDRESLEFGWVLHGLSLDGQQAVIEAVVPNGSVQNVSGHDVMTAVEPGSLAACFVDSQTLVLVSRDRMQTVLENQSLVAEWNEVADRNKHPALVHVRLWTDDAYLAVKLTSNMTDVDTAAALERLYDVTESIDLTINVQSELNLATQLVITPARTRELSDVADAYRALLENIERQLRSQWNFQRRSQQATGRATAEYFDRLTSLLIQSCQPTVRDDHLEIAFVLDPARVGALSLASSTIVPVTTHHLDDGRVTRTHLRQLGIALHEFYRDEGHLPEAFSRDTEGRPLLSWRVHLLPYLGEDAETLYTRFRLNEPWDSEHNRKLLSQMPEVYRSSRPSKEFTTRFLVPAGGSTLFGEPGGTKFEHVLDGLVNTIMLIEASREAAVEWTRPQDLNVSDKGLLKRIREPGRTEFHVLMGDGSQSSLSVLLNDKDLLGRFTINGGEHVSDVQR